MTSLPNPAQQLHYLVDAFFIMNLDSAVKPKKYWERGGILEQRRRPTVKLQSYLCSRTLLR